MSLIEKNVAIYIGTGSRTYRVDEREELIIGEGQVSVHHAGVIFINDPSKVAVHPHGKPGAISGKVIRLEPTEAVAIHDANKSRYEPETVIVTCRKLTQLNVFGRKIKLFQEG